MRQWKKIQSLLHEEHGRRLGKPDQSKRVKTDFNVIFNVIYALALLAVSPWVLYRCLAHGRYRRGIKQKLWGLTPADLPAVFLMGGSRSTAWFHAVSVGEVNLLPRVVAAFRAAHPDWRVVISSSTDTGFDLAKERFASDPVFFCPLDFSWAVRRTIRTLSPQLLVLAELEIWPNLTRIASEAGVKLAILNGRLSPRSASRYARGRMASTFSRFDWIGAIDSASADRFIACGAETQRVCVTGSIKFDNAPSTRDTIDVQRCARWAGVAPWHQVWVAGSTHPGEEEMALQTYLELKPEHPELRLVLVPRHQPRFDEVARLIQQAGLGVRRRSDPEAESNAWESQDVILVDTIGELCHWWGISRIALVGGSFGTRGGQNMLEPAGYGSAVCFGPNTKNFQDVAARLVEAGGAVRLANAGELTTFVRRCLDYPHAADQLGIRAQGLVDKHRRAIPMTIAGLRDLTGDQDAGRSFQASAAA